MPLELIIDRSANSDAKGTSLNNSVIIEEDLRGNRNGGGNHNVQPGTIDKFAGSGIDWSGLGNSIFNDPYLIKRAFDSSKNKERARQQPTAELDLGTRKQSPGFCT